MFSKHKLSIEMTDDTRRHVALIIGFAGRQVHSVKVFLL